MTRDDGVPALPFGRIAVVAPDDAAIRLIQTARELERRADRRLDVTVLRTGERRDLVVRSAEEVVALGGDGLGELEQALTEVKADALWPGWGPAAEDPAVSELCRRLGVTFVGPAPDVLRKVRDRVWVKQAAEQAGIPVVAWSGGPVTSRQEAEAAGERLGFPVMLKASAGGGAQGIRRVDGRAALADTFDRASAEAAAAFGEATLYLEQLVDRARHVEVPVFVDRHRAGWAPAVLDATLRRKGDKVLIESAPPGLAQEHLDQARRWAVELLASCGYAGTATVAFLADPETGGLRMLEVYPRLAPEHALVESTTGVDLVALQLHLAAGGTVDPSVTVVGHAFQARLKAEDPERGFAPTPGRVARLQLPTGPGVRADLAVGEHDEAGPASGHLVATVTSWGRDRDEARHRTQRALEDTVIVIEGGSTNKGFALELLERDEVREGRVDNRLVDRLAGEGELTVERDADLALLVAAADAYEAERALDQARFLLSGRRGRPNVSPSGGRSIELRHRGHTYRTVVSRTGPRSYAVVVDGAPVDLELDRVGSFEVRARALGRSGRAVSVVRGGDHLVEVDGTPHRFTRDEGGIVRAPNPGVVVSLPVAEGDEVDAGAPLAVIESMKMEAAVRAPFPGRVRHLLARTNTQVDAGAPLVQLEPLEREAEGPSEVERLAFPRAAAEAGSTTQRCREDITVVRNLVLGYDVSAAEARRRGDDLAEVCVDPRLAAQVGEAERELLTAFADVRVLFRGEREGDDDLEVRAPQEHLHAFLRAPETSGEGLPETFLEALHRALARYGVHDLAPSPALDEALFWIFQSQHHVDVQVPIVASILQRWLAQGASTEDEPRRRVLDRLIVATQRRFPVIADLAREVRFRISDEPLLAAARARVRDEVEQELAGLEVSDTDADRARHLQRLVDYPQPLASVLVPLLPDASPERARIVLESLTRRYYRIHDLEWLSWHEVGGRSVLVSAFERKGRRSRLVATTAPLTELPDALGALADALATVDGVDDAVADVYAWTDEAELADEAALAQRVVEAVGAAPLPAAVDRLVVAAAAPAPEGGMPPPVRHVVFGRDEDGNLREDEFLRGLHPMVADRLQLWRLANFDITRLPSADDVYLFRCVARENPRDERLVALGEVRDLTPALDEHGTVMALPQLERVVLDSLEAMRRYQAPLPPERRLQWNRVLLYVWPPLDLPLADVERLARNLAPATLGLGLEEVVVRCHRHDEDTGELRERVLRLANPAGTGFVLVDDDPPTEPLQPLDEYTQKVVQSRRRGAPYPYELVKLLTAPHAGGRTDVSGGEFVEHDLDDDGRLVPVRRAPGRNRAGIVAGVVTATTDRYPEGMRRVILLGDPTKALGSLAEAECRRIMAAFDLAEELDVPLEWFALSAGARIAMDSGTENMDWIAAILRRIIEFTQAGREVNVVVTGINVGAQPYWNAEATMLMHTKGILVMTPDSAMVLTGKQALDYSGSVSAEDNTGIGGYERIMGPNGQGQYWAPDLEGAIGVLLAHYDHTYVAPDERFPRRAVTSDPLERDVRDFPHAVEGSPFTRVGDIFSDTTNPERKQPFDIRTVMSAVTDQDHPPLERWRDLRDGDTVVVWDAHLGGLPVSMLGIEGRALPRRGVLPADGPDQWTSGTLFPVSSRKVARAVNAASGNRPLVVMANLSGFDGSPESMRLRQLEFGAEIGRAVVNFDGPIVFCVVSRYHGGAFVVFSQRLNENLETIAVEGAHASVIGGAPAAAVVFAGEVKARTSADERVTALEAAVAEATGPERVARRAELARLTSLVRSEKLGEVAEEFDTTHSVERARSVGSVSTIIPAAELRPYLIAAVERGMQRELDRIGAGGGSAG